MRSKIKRQSKTNIRFVRNILYNKIKVEIVKYLKQMESFNNQIIFDSSEKKPEYLN